MSNVEEEGQPVSQVFCEFAPEDFEFFEPSACWVPPCWISVPLGFRAVSDRARERFFLPLKLPFQADPFAREGILQQVSTQFFAIYEQAQLAEINWTSFLWQKFTKLQRAFAETANLFQPPMRFVPRSDFEHATLDTILRTDPETFEMYIADDTDSSKREVFVLRIHSSLWHYTPKQKYLWFEKRVPWRLHREDVLPWFNATVKKLPRKRQPIDWTPWTDKFLRSHPEFAPMRHASELPWNERPPIVLVFGTREEVGYAAFFRLERTRIEGIKRVGKELFLIATIASRYLEEGEKLWWDFRIISPTAVHAERLELRLLSGEQIHFGIGDDISGIVAANHHLVHFINVDPELIKGCYSREGMMLLSFDPARFRHKTYHYYKEAARNPEEGHRL